MILAQAEVVKTATDFAEAAAGKNVVFFLVVVNFAMAVAIGWMARAFQMRHDRVCARLDEVQKERTDFLEKTLGQVVAALEKHADSMDRFSTVLESWRLIEPPRR